MIIVFFFGTDCAHDAPAGGFLNIDTSAPLQQRHVVASHSVCQLLASLLAILCSFHVCPRILFCHFSSVAIFAQVLHLWRLVNPRDRVATGVGGLRLVPVQFGIRCALRREVSRPLSVSVGEIQWMESRGAQGAKSASRAASEAAGVPTRTAKEEGHAHEVFALALAGEDWKCLALLEVRVLHRQERARARWTVSWHSGTPMTGTRRTAVGCGSRSGRLRVDMCRQRTWPRQLRRLGGTGVTWHMSWGAICSAPSSSQSSTTLTSHGCLRSCATLVYLFGR